MPLLVVLLMATLANKFEDPPGKVGLAIGVRHGNVGHVFPGLVWDSRYNLQNLEFGQAPFSAIKEIHDQRLQVRPFRRATEVAGQNLV